MKSACSFRSFWHFIAVGMSHFVGMLFPLVLIRIVQQSVCFTNGTVFQASSNTGFVSVLEPDSPRAQPG